MEKNPQDIVSRCSNILRSAYICSFNQTFNYSNTINFDNIHFNIIDDEILFTLRKSNSFLPIRFVELDLRKQNC